MIGIGIIVPQLERISNYESSTSDFCFEKLPLSYSELKCGEVRDIYFDSISQLYSVEKLHLYTSLFNKFDRHAALSIVYNDGTSIYFDPSFGIVARKGTTNLSFHETRKNLMAGNDVDFVRLFETGYDIDNYYIAYDVLFLNSLVVRRYRTGLGFNISIYSVDMNNVYFQHEIVIYYMIFLSIIFVSISIGFQLFILLLNL